MHGSIFLLFYRRGGSEPNTPTTDAAARAYFVVARQTYTAGAVTAQAYTAGAEREQTYHAGAVVTDHA